MGKKIIITSGPTNERIDSVMKITNMATGSLGVAIAEVMLHEPVYTKEVEKIYFISSKLSRKPDNDSDLDEAIAVWSRNKLEFIEVESTQDLLDTLKDLLQREHIDAVIHSAAVGDYKGEYVIRAEDLVRELWTGLKDGRITSPEDMMAVIQQPQSVQDDETKISSYEPNLMVKLGLTPKVIGYIKDLSPATMLIGFKLLDGVTKDELFEVASRLRQTNHADYIIANDLSKIGDGRHWAMVVGRNGIETECETKQQIARAIAQRVFA